jgi:putative transcriptional regulator
MSDDNTVRVRRVAKGKYVQVLPDGSTQPMPKGRTDWARLAAMTEEEIIANALSDPDNPPLTDEDFKRMERVPNVRRIRDQLEMTQLEFSETFHIPLGTLRDWEQGPRIPDSAARAFLRAIEQDPECVKAALDRSYQTVEGQ